MYMKELSFLIVCTVMVMFFTGCTGCTQKILEVDTEILQKKIYEPSATIYESLQQSTVLYLDHSTCVIDARQNSKVFNALRPQLGQYSDTLILIKGNDFESTPLNRSDNEVFRILQNIQVDIPYSNILKTVEKICNGNQQAILITDCEYIEKGKGNNGKDLCHDQDPYLSEPFKNWLRKGHCIYTVVEPYQERNKGKIYDKKRFYFCFTDDRMENPFSQKMLAEIQPFLQDSICRLFKMTNSDISVQGSKSEMIPKKFLACNVDSFVLKNRNNFDFVNISDDWRAIRKYVMKLQENFQPIPDEQSVPLIQNLAFNDGENYIVESMQVVAKNITSTYLSSVDSTISVKEINASDGFSLDKDTLKINKLIVLLTDKIFTEGYLSNDYNYEGNLIRLDFVITKVGLKQNFDSDMFTWQSLINNEKAICVAKSIDNVLHDSSIMPTNNERKVMHTIFLQTQSYPK